MPLPALVVTAYCERSGPGFWAEPFNALSSLAFVLVALLLLQQLRRQPHEHLRIMDIRILIMLTAATGIGSFLWHTLARQWAEWLDVIPIVLYIGLYLPVFLVRVARASTQILTAWIAGFLALNLAILWLVPGTALNGSIYYLPALILLVLFTRYSHRLYLASTCFLLALAFRSVDQIACDTIPTGTHFLWHLAISLCVYVTTMVLIESLNGWIRPKADI